MKTLYTLHSTLYTQRGFTLIEMIVVVSMVGLLAGVSVVSFRSSQHDDYLNVAAQRIQDALRIAQNHAQTGVIAGYEGARSFGVHIDKEAGTAVIFADTYGATIGLWDGEGTADAPKDKQFKEITQPISVDVDGKQSISIESITVLPGSSSKNVIDLSFRAISAATLFDGKGTEQRVSVKLKNIRNSHTKTVTLYRLSGRIDIN
ncbi:prepilin-type N-terminal cleavage/methylation domain-containing protein [Candidatus Uhrbacteria bacterium]|nr:prepilin-type N-terminal cleavage/methylation domain-containing protein [Candidatus Uhrbacteria bacterium]